jgi:RNA polymerase sigma-70 factor (ECF subfamily)
VYGATLEDGRHGFQFQTTQWCVIVAAASPTNPAAREALAALCNAYWFPLYAYIRRRGYRVDDAEDLTQAFFAKLLEEKATFRRADPGRGKFRTYLLGTLRHFLSNHSDRCRAARRGGDQKVLPLDVGEAEGRLVADASDARPPEWHFDRAWALSVLQVALEAVRAEYASAGKAALFEALQPYLSGDGQLLLRDLAHQLAMSEGAVRVALHRVRQRYGESIRQEIARTLGSLSEIDEEVRHLFEVLRS